METVRDSAFGHLVRLITNKRFFKYPEEVDPSLCDKWYNEEKSGFAAHHGKTEAPEVEDENGEKQKQSLDELRAGRANKSRDNSHSNASSQTHGGERSDNDARSGEETDKETRGRQNSDQERTINRSGVPVDPEKGKDVQIVDWDGPDDPEVS